MLWLTVLLMPLIAFAGGLGFQVTGCMMGVLGLLTWAIDRKGSSYLLEIWVTALLVFMGWAWISTTWSPHQANYWGGNASILFGLVCFLLFMPLTLLRLSDDAKVNLAKLVLVAGILCFGQSRAC